MRSAYGLDSVTDRPGWHAHAACASGEWPVDWWTSEDTSQRDWAACVCLGCPVRVECDEWAREHMQECDQALYAGVYYTRIGNGRRATLVRPAVFQPTPRTPGTLARRKRAGKQLGEYEEQVLLAIRAGASHRSLAAMFGVAQDTMRQFLIRRGIVAADVRDGAA